MKNTLLIIFFILIPIHVSAQDKLNIAVINFQGQNISAMDAAIISGFIRSRLVESKKFRIIDKENMDKILTEQGFQQTGCTTQECAVQIGNILNVQKMISGTVSRLLGIYYITADCIDVETGEIQYSKSIEFREEEKLKSKIEEIADKLIYDMTGKESEIEEKKKVIKSELYPVEKKGKSKDIFVITGVVSGVGGIASMIFGEIAMSNYNNAANYKDASKYRTQVQTADLIKTICLGISGISFSIVILF